MAHKNFEARIGFVALAFLLSPLLAQVSAEEGRTRAAVFNDGRQEYQENCAACHGQDATGRGELCRQADQAAQGPYDDRQIKQR